VDIAWLLFARNYSPFSEKRTRGYMKTIIKILLLLTVRPYCGCRNDWRMYASDG
jgi:hypothetical protein